MKKKLKEKELARRQPRRRQERQEIQATKSALRLKAGQTTKARRLDVIGWRPDWLQLLALAW